ncbi:MAG: hypothetical protein HQL56_05475 [Magnetococcales bacterium]|nr:hypothetical protein [Magnetococcales bacterium]
MSDPAQGAFSNHPPVPTYLQPRLRLFLSIDLIGSTAIKQRDLKGTGSDPAWTWRNPIQFFYQEVQQTIAKIWQRFEVKLKVNLPEYNRLFDPLHFWKALGDELIYCQTITHSYQVYYAIKAWIQTAETFREQLKQQYKDTKIQLDVKMYAWVAGFPVINCEVALQRNAHTQNMAQDESLPDPEASMLQRVKAYWDSENRDDVILDFIGPSMDIGFRLGSLANRRQMPISLELAYILASVMTYRQCSPEAPALPDLSLHYMGRKELKGVMEGNLYPVFWLDATRTNLNPYPLEKCENTIINSQQVQPQHGIELITEFVKDVNNPFLLTLPYIVSDSSDPVLTTSKPPEHHEQIKRWLTVEPNKGPITKEASLETDRSTITTGVELAEDSVKIPL